MNTLALIVMMLSGPLLAQAQKPAEKAFAAIVGIPWTASQKEIQAAFPGLNCTIPGQLCLAHDRSVGNVSMTDITIFLNGGTMQSVLMKFNRRDFRTVKKYLIQKYGQPTVNRLDQGVPELIWTGRAVDLDLEDGDRSDPAAGLMFVVIGTGSPAERRKR